MKISNLKSNEFKPVTFQEKGNIPDLSPGTIEIVEKAVEIAGLKKGDKVLDAGCGFGRSSEFISEKKGIKSFSMDYSIAMLKKSVSKINDKKVVAKLPDNPFTKSAFEGIISQCVVSLVESKVKCINDFGYILKNKGKLILSDIYIREIKNMIKNDQNIEGTCMNGAIKLDQWESLVEEAGFKILYLKDYTRLLKEMACRIIFEYGSFEEYRKKITGHNLIPGNCLKKQTGYGYFLMVAEKK